MKLSEIPFKEIYVGQRVQSDLTKCFGIVMEKNDIEEDFRKEDNLVSIWWDNDKIALNVRHFQYDMVTVLEFINE